MEVKHSRSELSKYYPSVMVDLSYNIIETEIRVLRDGVWYDVIIKEALNQSSPEAEIMSYARFHKNVYTQQYLYTMPKDLAIAPSKVQISEHQRMEALSKRVGSMKPNKDDVFIFLIESPTDLEIAYKLLDERDRLLHAIPECKEHGRDCIPHAIEWVEKMKNLNIPDRVM